MGVDADADAVYILHRELATWLTVAMAMVEAVYFKARRRGDM